MTLITGLVCAINVYFVVDFLPTLQGLGYYIPLSLLLVAYVVFITYLVGLEPQEGAAGWGTASPVGAHRPALFAPQIWTCSVAHGARFLAGGHHDRLSFGVSLDPRALARTQ